MSPEQSGRFQSEAYQTKPRTILQAPGWTESLWSTAPWLMALGVCGIVLVNVQLGVVATATLVVAITTITWMLNDIMVKPRRMSASGKAVLITGCDSGFGYWLAKHLDELGAIVFAGCLHSDGSGAEELKSACSDRMHVLQMDVTDEEQVLKCLQDVQDVLEKAGQRGLWGVVNNAGVCHYGNVELSTMRLFQLVTEVNQLGMVRVTKTFLEQIRKAKGRVVNVSSVKGRVSFPCNAAYTMTKYAGEAFSDTLRLEMARFGINVSIIQPCNFGGATDGLSPAIRGPEFEEMWQGMSPDVRGLYGLQYLQKQFDALLSLTPTANFNVFPVVDAMVDALFSVNPKRRYFIGGGNEWFDMYKVVALMVAWMPGWLADRYILHLSKPFLPPVEGEAVD